MCHLFVEKLGILWAVRINLDDLYTTVPVCLSWCWGVERRLKECFRSVIQTARNGECLCHSLVTEGRVMDLRNIPSTFEACEQDRRVLVLRQKRSRWFCHFRIARMFTPSIFFFSSTTADVFFFFFFIYYNGRIFKIFAICGHNSVRMCGRRPKTSIGRHRSGTMLQRTKESSTYPQGRHRGKMKAGMCGMPRLAKIKKKVDRSCKEINLFRRFPYCMNERAELSPIRFIWYCFTHQTLQRRTLWQHYCIYRVIKFKSTGFLKFGA